MDTLIARMDPRSPSRKGIAGLGRLLADGGLVAFPTETVYGIAARRDDPGAVRRLCELKARRADKPLTVHVPDAGDIERLAGGIGPRARRLVDRLLPGPLTLILPDAKGGTTGFRLPVPEVARALLRAAEGDVVATSANLAGEAPLTDGEMVVAAFSGRVDGILAAGPSRYGRPSTVVRVSPGGLEILREGVLDAEEVRRAACLTILFVCTGNLCRSPMAEGILRHLLAERMGVAEEELVDRGILVVSAGTAAVFGEPATPPAVAAARKWGADISRHSARPLTPGLISGADVIVTSDRSHEETILSFAPEAFGKIRPLRRDGRDVPDPYGRSDATYRRTAAVIREELTALAEEALAVVDAKGQG